MLPERPVVTERTGNPSATERSLPDASVQGTRLTPHLPWLLVLLIVQAVILYFFRTFDIDDTWIFMRYARNLAAGDGLVYNPGEPSEGYTSFLWVILLAAGMKAGWDGLVVARIIGAGLAFATTIFAYLLGRRATPARGYVTLVAPTAVALSLPLAVWAMSGMGTVLFAFLVTLTLYLHLESHKRSRPYLAAAGWVCGLAALARPEGWLFLVVIVAHRLWRPTRHGRLADTVAYLAGFLVLTMPHLLWRHYYYGYWLPNTFYVKALVSKGTGVVYTWDCLRYHGGLAILALAGLPLALRRGSEEYRVIVLSVTLWALHVLRLGDWMPLFRFYVPILPLCFVLVQAGVAEVANTLRRNEVGTIRWRVLAALAALALVWVVVCELHMHRGIRGMSDLYIEVGKELHRRAQPGDTLVAIDAGAIPYFSQLPTTDIIGLTDAHIAHTPYKHYQFDRPVFGDEYAAPVRYDSVYILGKQPTFIELPTGGRVMAGGEVGSSRPEVYLLMDEPEFKQHYVPLFERGHLTIFVRKDKAKQRGLR